MRIILIQMGQAPVNQINRESILKMLKGDQGFLDSIIAVYKGIEATNGEPVKGAEDALLEAKLNFHGDRDDGGAGTTIETVMFPQIPVLTSEEEVILIADEFWKDLDANAPDTLALIADVHGDTMAGIRSAVTTLAAFQRLSPSCQHIFKGHFQAIKTEGGFFATRNHVGWISSAVSPPATPNLTCNVGPEGVTFEEGGEELTFEDFVKKMLEAGGKADGGDFSFLLDLVKLLGRQAKESFGPRAPEARDYTKSAPDIVLMGVDPFELIHHSSSKSQGWSRTVSVMNLPGNKGMVINTINRERQGNTESSVFIPGIPGINIIETETTAAEGEG